MTLPSYTSPERGQYHGISMESFYLPMRDGVRLAVDVYYPAPIKEGHKYPTLLHQTRYWRLPQLRWPFSLFSNGLISHTGKYVKEIVMSGYVFVNIDSRGSGASFGNRPYPWSPDEVKDGAEVVDWIVDQEWSNGKVGAVGVSYTGTTAEFLLRNQHPAVKACMPMFSLYDVYEDIALPGGVPHDGFVLNWGKANALLDENKLPIDNPLIKLLVKGVKPVGGKSGREDLQKALEDHKKNLQVSETSRGVDFRDQAPANRIVNTMDEFSPHHYRDKINASGAALYSASGWMDGAYPHAAIKRYLNADMAVNKLILGPWDHGARFHITPGKQKKASLAPVYEACRFFDRFLKDLPTGVDEENPVWYYTMQEEAWKSSASWPPTPKRQLSLFLGEDGHLSPDAPRAAKASDIIYHDARMGTGKYTRWQGLFGQMTTGRLYPDRKKRDELLLTYDSEVLEEDLEVTGHGLVHLFVKTEAKDGAFFVYLEDITPGGEVWYVTEGLFRAMHRKINNEAPTYQDAVPYHSFKKEDSQPLVAGEVAELVFDLLPISYLFRKGHRIRIAIATGDADNFRQLCPEGSAFKIVRNARQASKVVLPVC